MTAFRRVEDRRAGPDALGILVPPGLRTVVILRPRPLGWDLLALRGGDGPAWPPAFCAFTRDEAAGVARKVQRDLEQRAGTGGSPLEAVRSPGGGGYLVWCKGGDLRWVVCPRVPGKPYEPAVFTTRSEAGAVEAALAHFLWPPAEARQEFYFNTQNFGRPT
jgi:hypothetical protein